MLYALDNGSNLFSLQVTPTPGSPTPTVTALQLQTGGVPIAEIRNDGTYLAFRETGTTGIYAVWPGAPLQVIPSVASYPVNDWFIGVLPNAGDAIVGAMLSYGTGVDNPLAQAGFGGTPLSVIPITNPALPGSLWPVGQFGRGRGYNNDIIFALSGDHSQLVQFVVSGQEYTCLQLNSSVPIKCFSVCGYQGALEMFCIGMDNCAYHMRQDTSSPSGWSTLLCIDASQTYVTVSSLAIAAGPFAFFTTQSSEVIECSQDAATNDWIFRAVNLEGRNDLIAVSAYSTQVSVSNSDGTAYALQSATVAAQDASTPAALVEINGQMVYIDYETPWTGLTDITGRLQLSLEVTGIGSPAYYVSFPFSSTPLPVDPSGAIFDQMQNLPADGSGLLSASMTTDNHGGTQKLLSTQEQQDMAGTISATITQATGMVKITEASPTGMRLHPRTDRRVVRHAQVVGNGAWKVERVGGKVQFSTLTDEQAAAEKAASAGFSIFDVDWGDVIDVITSGIAAVANIVIQGVEATFTFVIGAATHVWSATVSTVSHVFDLRRIRLFVDFSYFSEPLRVVVIYFQLG